MNELAGGNWPARYSSLVGSLSASGDAATLQSGVFLCGMSTVVDARVDMHNTAALANAPDGSGANDLFKLLQDRAARGVGGEVKVEWPAGPDWIRSNIKVRHALGGTGPQAAWVLSKLGAKSVIALEDRHALMLNQIPAGVMVAEDGKLCEAGDVTPLPQTVPETFIFEYTAGKPVGHIVPRRSSRIIVRFIDRGLQYDREFNSLSTQLASSAAAGLLSGLNDVKPEKMAEEAKNLFALARSWRDAGLKVIHFELAGYSSLELLNGVLSALRGSVTSLGMSQSEFLALYPGVETPMEAMIALGERLSLSRVCVHADNWAASVTRCDPHQELRALMAGCAIASARAAAGAPVDRVTVAADAQFEPLPFDGYARKGDWSFVACSAPYLAEPATTLGLGDSFTAGCLLVLGRKTIAHGVEV
ncbi:ADP-dependent phosphofructokinase/glucokinase-like protein (plasmid) [Rhizobium leguminosarum bv. trifolii WSM2304]|uniref:ADP-dependent phosphofructokinase/glucokinase-like protein n=1 Tax=Rhizobium leguminosarum bv. trifolii (strain WSM2304) TaxID=395492 RepID=A0ABF7QUW2_RHILW|nr:ADP-dependent glucokinase/phosphofructokinase [Rhizobium leguminosarum]ACI58203.1 ADP-dependent phosphofructokinase/glucokinase-like protein [Rhizobium leguminosarum bv. trifolii WSM2304]